MEAEEFDTIVIDVIDSLPDFFQQSMENVEVVVEAWPTPQQLASVGVRFPTHLFGLYQGIPRTRRSTHYGLVAPDKITIFQKPIERVCRTEKELREKVREVVLHEIGHHFGLSEAQLAEIEREQRRRKRQLQP